MTDSRERGCSDGTATQLSIQDVRDIAVASEGNECREGLSLGECCSRVVERKSWDVSARSQTKAHLGKG